MNFLFSKKNNTFFYYSSYKTPFYNFYSKTLTKYNLNTYFYKKETYKLLIQWHTMLKIKVLLFNYFNFKIESNKFLIDQVIRCILIKIKKKIKRVNSLNRSWQ